MWRRRSRRSRGYRRSASGAELHPGGHAGPAPGASDTAARRRGRGGRLRQFLPAGVAELLPCRILFSTAGTDCHCSSLSARPISRGDHLGVPAGGEHPGPHNTEPRRGSKRFQCSRLRLPLRPPGATPPNGVAMNAQRGVRFEVDGNVGRFGCGLWLARPFRPPDQRMDHAGG